MTAKSIIDKYAHDFRGMAMSEMELKKMLMSFVMEILPGEKEHLNVCGFKFSGGGLPCTCGAEDYNRYRQALLNRIRGKG